MAEPCKNPFSLGLEDEIADPTDILPALEKLQKEKKARKKSKNKDDKSASSSQAPEVKSNSKDNHEDGETDTHRSLDFSW